MRAPSCDQPDREQISEENHMLLNIKLWEIPSAHHLEEQSGGNRGVDPQHTLGNATQDRSLPATQTKLEINQRLYNFN